MSQQARKKHFEQVVFWIVLVPEYIPAAEEEGA
jgi:hypothetical protein